MNKVILILIISAAVASIAIGSSFVIFEFYKNSNIIDMQHDKMDFSAKSFDYWLDKTKSTNEVKRFLEIYPDAVYSVTDFSDNEIEIVFSDYDNENDVISNLEIMYFSGSDFPEFELQCIGEYIEIMEDFTVLSFLNNTDCQEIIGDSDFDADKILAKLSEQNMIDEFYMDLVLEHSKYLMFSETFPDHDVMILNSNEKLVSVLAEQVLGNNFNAFIIFFYDVGEASPTRIDYACFVDGQLIHDGMSEGIGFKINECKEEYVDFLQSLDEFDDLKDNDDNMILSELKDAHSIVSNHMSKGDPRLLITATFVDEQRELLVIWLDPTHVAKPWSEDDLRQYLRIDVPIELSFGVFTTD